jgi:hypothetical protein
MKKYYISFTDSIQQNELYPLVTNVVNEKNSYPLFFVAECTDEQVEVLKSNENVTDVSSLESIKELEVDDAAKTVNSVGRSSGPGIGSSIGDGNWGLIRHSNDVNPYTSVDTAANNTYIYNYDGDGVDVIFLSQGMIDIDNSEYKTSGTSRIQQFQWNTLPNMSGMETISYTGVSTSTHAEGCLALACSNTYGWATGANIYIIPRNQLTDSTDYFDAAKEFHLKKISDAAGGTYRPTVFFASYGYDFGSYYHAEHEYNFRGNTFTTYKGQSLKKRPKIPDFGAMELLDIGLKVTFKTTLTTGVYPAITQAAQDLSDAGVITVYSAGNEGQKCDHSNGTDYNNYFKRDNNNTSYYYNRGSAQWADHSIIVANINSRFNTFNDDKEELNPSSNRGPRVDCAAAGTIIDMSDNINQGGASVSGTSFACPQIAGMAALVLGKYPNDASGAPTTPAQMRKFFREQAISSESLYDGKTTLTTDLGDFGDPEYFNDGLNLQGYSGNITYLDPALPFDPSTQYASDVTITYPAETTTTQGLNYTIAQINTKLASI